MQNNENPWRLNTTVLFGKDEGDLMGDQIHQILGIDDLRGNFLKFTRIAFNTLNVRKNSRILDIGCGIGLPTLILASLSTGEIIGIDHDHIAIEHLQTEIALQDLGSRVKAICTSFQSFVDSPESFDIIWEEGVIHVMDLQETLTKVIKLLNSNGIFVMNETNKWVAQHRDIFLQSGFIFQSQIVIPEHAWWTEYFAILEHRLNMLNKVNFTAEQRAMIQKYRAEIEMVKKDPGSFDCSFFILQKGNIDR